MRRILITLILPLFIGSVAHSAYHNGSGQVPTTRTYHNGSGQVPVDQQYYNGSEWVSMNGDEGDITLAINDASQNNTVALDSNAPRGQRFPTTNSGTPKAIRLIVTSFSADDVITCRLSDSATTLTSGYMSEGSVTVTSTGETDVVMGSSASLSDSTNYYFSCKSSDGSVYVARSLGSNYPEGLYYWGVGGWDLTSSSSANAFIFEIVGE